MRSQRLFHRILIPTAFLAGCARMEPPPGGPEDKVRPYVAGVYPAPGAVGAPRKLDARIGFSEWVDKDVTRGKVWLSPPTEKKIEVKHKGNVLEITSEAPLDTGTTYVLGISGGVKDLVGLPLEAPFQLVFSTGAALDSGRLSGRLSAFPGAVPPAGSFAALYPLEPALRARFGHLSHGGAAARADSTPQPFRERAAYVAPADSQGAFLLEGVRPGNYRLVGFQDQDGDLFPDPALEPMASGSAVAVSAAPGPAMSLTLSPMDTAGNRLLEVRWAHESLLQGRSLGTVRLKFARPVHPAKALRRELYGVRKGGADAKGGASVPVMGIGFDPDGALELLTAPLEPESSYTVSCGAVPDIQGNALDTSRDEASFKATLADSAAKPATPATPAAAPGTPPPGTASALSPADSFPAPVFLAPRGIDGKRERLALQYVLPARGLEAYYPRILSDSLVSALAARLEIKHDTVAVPFFLTRSGHHGLAFRLGPVPLDGRMIHVGYKTPKPAASAAPTPAPGKPAKADSSRKSPAPPPDTGKIARPAGTPGGTPPVAAAPRQSFTLADSAKLGSLQFRQDATARGSLLVLRSIPPAQEFARYTPEKDEFTVDSLPAGWYSVDYFRDADRDTLWNPGRIRPWTAQEEFVRYADSVEVKPDGISAGSASGRRISFPPSW